MRKSYFIYINGISMKQKWTCHKFLNNHNQQQNQNICVTVCISIFIVDQNKQQSDLRDGAPNAMSRHGQWEGTKCKTPGRPGNTITWDNQNTSRQKYATEG